jgi:hypothetical protein
MKSSVSDPSRLRLRLSAVRRHRRPTLDVKSHWPTGPPDFVGVGVQKAGTSWWYQCLVDHPLVFHPPRVAKERHFFDDPAMEHADRTEVAARYSRQFPRPPGTVTGEWTPRYLYDR